MAFGTLTITYADGRQAQRELRKPTERIGQASDNDIVLGEPGVAPYHAEILCAPNDLQFLDLGTPGGTTLNGARLIDQDPHPLGEGSVIEIGGVRIVASMVVTSVAGQQMSLALSTNDVSIPAGGIATIDVTVVNRSSVTDGISISVESLPEGWAVVTPPRFRLFPNDSGSGKLELRPPKAVTSLAQTYPFTVTATSEERPTDRLQYPATLTVERFTQFRTVLDPQQTQGRLWGVYQLQVSNESNHNLGFRFEGKDDEGALAFRFSPKTLAIDPGKSDVVAVRSRPRFGSLIGRSKTFPFSAKTIPIDGSAPEQSNAGRFVYTPLLPPWALAAILGLLVLLCGGTAYANKWPPFNRTPTSAAVAPTNTAAVGTPADNTAQPGGEEPTTAPPGGGVTQAPAATTGTAEAPTTGTAEAPTTGTAEAPTTAGAVVTQAPANPGSVAGQLGQGSQAAAVPPPNYAATQTVAAFSFGQTQTAAALNATGSTSVFSQTLDRERANLALAQTQAAANLALVQTQAAANLAATQAQQAADRKATQSAIALNAPATATATLTPSTTPTASVTPSITSSPTSTAEPDQVITFDKINGLPIGSNTHIFGDEFVSQGVIICTYHTATTPDSNLSGAPDCDPAGLNNGVTNMDVRQDRPIIYLPRSTDSFTAPVYTLASSVYKGEVAVINFTKNVFDVTIDVWCPPRISCNYVMYAYNGFGSSGDEVASFRTGYVDIPGSIYQLTIRSTGRPLIRQVEVANVQYRGASEYLYNPIYISKITYRYVR